MKSMLLIGKFVKGNMCILRENKRFKKFIVEISMIDGGYTSAPFDTIGEAKTFLSETIAQM